MPDSKERIQVESRDELRAWLRQHHTASSGLWLVTYKKQCGAKYLPYDDIVEELLCFGWIDSLPRKLDDERTMLWIAPRKPGSAWSKRNKERVAKLVTAGVMTPAGMEKIDAAQQDGTWNALDEVERLTIPPDLTAALAGYTAAAENFEAFPRSVRRGILEWIGSAKKPETRARRIEETARLAQDNIRANQWRP